MSGVADEWGRGLQVLLIEVTQFSAQFLAEVEAE